MKKPMKKVLCIGGAALLGLWIALFVLRGGAGPWRSHIQDHARKGQRIDAAWLAAEDGGEELAALVFYPAEGDRHAVFSLYRKDLLPLLGWHFRAGGSIGEIDRGVAELAPEGFGERAYVSMNAPGVCKAELGNGESVALDPEEPFALVLPRSAGTVIFYDAAGNEVETTRYGM